MKIEKVFDIRFLVPPILTIFFIVFSSRSYLSGLLIGEVDTSWIIFWGIGILALGFLISSINECFIKKLLQETYIGDDLSRIKTMPSFEKWGSKISNKIDASNLYLAELISWMILDGVDRQGSSHIWNKVNKRWNMAVANYNSFTALILAGIIAPISWLVVGKCSYPSQIWFLVWFSVLLFFAYIFYINGKQTKDSVFKMHRALLEGPDPSTSIGADQRC